MKLRKLTTDEILLALRDRNKFKEVLIEALVYLLKKKQIHLNDIQVIRISEILQTIKEMMNIETSLLNLSISVKIGMALRDLGFKSFHTKNGNKIKITKNEFLLLENIFENLKNKTGEISNVYKKQ